MDFGNYELRERDSLMTLGLEFKVIPFQAVSCSIPQMTTPPSQKRYVEALCVCLLLVE